MLGRRHCALPRLAARSNHGQQRFVLRARNTGQDFKGHLIACLTCIETVQDLFLGCSGMRVVTGALKRCVDVFSTEQDNFEAITALLTALNFAIENHGST